MLTEEQINAIQEKILTPDPVEWMQRFARAIESAVRAEYADVPHEEWNGEGWESLAWHLCAEENGEDACNDLLWVGGAVPEPWGDRWQRYEGDAKRMIRLVKEHYNPKIGGEE